MDLLMTGKYFPTESRLERYSGLDPASAYQVCLSYYRSWVIVPTGKTFGETSMHDQEDEHSVYRR